MSPPNTVHQTLRESHQLALSDGIINSCVVPRFAICLVFSRLFLQLIIPYWLSCWASNDMEQGFSSEADIHSLSSSRSSPLYHASDDRSFITVLSVSATGTSPDPDTHNPHPHVLFILALSLLLTSHLRPGLPHRFGLLFGLIWLKLTPYRVPIAVFIACLNSMHCASCPYSIVFMCLVWLSEQTGILSYSAFGGFSLL
jgi:hypothetical protein